MRFIAQLGPPRQGVIFPQQSQSNLKSGKVPFRRRYRRYRPRVNRPSPVSPANSKFNSTSCVLQTVPAIPLLQRVKCNLETLMRLVVALHGIWGLQQGPSVSTGFKCRYSIPRQ